MSQLSTSEKHFKNPLRNAILLHTLEWFRISISPLLKLCPWKLPPPSQSTVQVLAFSVEGRDRRLWCHEQLIFPCVKAAHLLCCRRAQTFWRSRDKQGRRKLGLNLILAQLCPLSYRSDTILFKTHQNMSLFEL